MILRILSGRIREITPAEGLVAEAPFSRIRFGVDLHDNLSYNPDSLS